MNVTRFHIPGMDCATEQEVIRNRLQREPAVKTLAFDLLDRIVTVYHEDGADRVVEAALADIQMRPRRLDEAARGLASAGAPSPRSEGLVLAGAGVAALVAEVVAVAVGDEAHPAVIALSALALLLAGGKPFKKGLVALKTLTLNINLLMVVAVLGAMAIGQWPEAAMVTALFAVAELIEARSLGRARDAIRGLMALSPETARVAREDLAGQGHDHDHDHDHHDHAAPAAPAATTWVEVPVAGVSPGARVQVLPGERLPLDGVIHAGHTAIDQAPITGESVPVDRGPGDPVFAGTINGHGLIELTVTAGQGDTTLARIARTIREAQSQKAPTERFVDRFARIYTPAVFVFALLVAVVPPLFMGGAWSEWLYQALVLLVIACPCALVISTPVTVVSALAAAARRGILVKGGVHLEGARHLRAIALDKTGTLTHGAPVLTDVVPVGEASVGELLSMAASLEATSAHPLAAAVVAGHTERTGGAALRPVNAARNLVGRGLEGHIDGRLVVVGSHRLAEERGVCGPEVEAVLETLEAAGRTAMIVWADDQVLGVLGVADTIRETSAEAVRDLRAQGVAVAMLTGDNGRTARAVAAGVGIEEVHAEFLPEDKLRAIEALAARHGAVGMVGDGINDAPALARATIGFAMGAAGTDTALETADVALMQDDLRRIPELIELSRRTRRTLVVNITLALGLKAAFFVLSFLGLATLWMAVFADLGASLIVALNGLSLLRPSVPSRPRPTRDRMAP